MDRIDRIARLLAGGFGRRSLLAGLAAVTVGTEQANALSCYCVDAATGDCYPGTTDAHCGAGNRTCVRCRPRWTCREGRCVMKPRYRRHRRR